MRITDPELASSPRGANVELAILFVLALIAVLLAGILFVVSVRRRPSWCPSRWTVMFARVCPCDLFSSGNSSSATVCG